MDRWEKFLYEYKGKEWEKYILLTVISTEIS